MARFARWATMIVSTGVVFLVSLWLFRFLSFQWMPHNTADRWVVAAAFATVAASAVAAATAWWAGRDEQSEVPRKEQPQKIGSVGGQEITRSDGAVFGPLGDYRGAVFNIQSADRAQPESSSNAKPEPRKVAEEKSQPAVAEHDSQADVIPLRGRSERNREFPAGARSWANLAEVLRQTSLEGQDWVALSVASRQLQIELEAQHITEPDIPETVPKLASKLRDLLGIITDSSTPPNQFSARLAEAQRAKGYLLRLLTPKSG